MVEAGLIGALVVAETLGYRRAMFGKPPSRPLRLISASIVSLVIHIGFHAAASAAPSALTATAFVFAGWATFIIWWKWVARAPNPWGLDDGEDAGGPGGGGPGVGPAPHGGPGGDGFAIDWEAREREMDEFTDSGRLAGVP